MNRPKRFVCAGADGAAPGRSPASNVAPEKKTSGGRCLAAGGGSASDCAARAAALPVLARCRGGEGAKRGCWRRAWLVIACGGGVADADSLSPRQRPAGSWAGRWSWSLCIGRSEGLAAAEAAGVAGRWPSHPKTRSGSAWRKVWGGCGAGVCVCEGEGVRGRAAHACMRRAFFRLLLVADENQESTPAENCCSPWPSPLAAAAAAPRAATTAPHAATPRTLAA